MDTRTKEAVRYLGYGSHAIDDDTLALIGSSFEELERTAGRRIIYRIFDVSFQGETGLKIGTMEVDSRNLRRNLDGCRNVIVLGATLGAGVDMLLRRYSLTDMARVVVLQACAAALLEEYLDECQEELRLEQEAQGLYLRPRFSPGYGDFPIECQRDLIRVLDCARSIGLTLTEGCMMAPSKSVTAVIGAGRTVIRCHRQGCESCEKIDCIYRRDTL